MNINEAKNILLLYRHGTADAQDPDIAEALALAKQEPELKDWLVVHCARQFVIGEKFRQIAVPAGLKEQIISEQSVQKVKFSWRPKLVPALAVMIILLFGVLGFLWFPRQRHNDALAIYQNQMAGIALRGYGMDLLTNNLTQIRSYLGQNHAPADYVLPAALQKLAVAGCAIESWQNEKVSMICFRTGKPLLPGAQSDLWLFVVDRASLKDPAIGSSPQFSKINRLLIATWLQGDKVYLLGTEADEPALRQYL